MEREPGTSEQPKQFPSRIGQDLELWKQYRETHGPEAYKYRRLYEETSQQLQDIYLFAQEQGIELPNNGPDFT